MTNLKTLLVPVLAAAALLSACQKEPGTGTDTAAIDNLLLSGGKLETRADKYEVETYNDTIPGIVNNASDVYSDDIYGKAYAVKTKQKYSIVNNPMEYATINPWDGIWPGALVQGATIADGSPAVIPIWGKRIPGRIYLNVVSGNPQMEQWYREVPLRPTEVTQAMNELLDEYFGGAGFAAQTAFEMSVVHSVEEIALKLGLNVKGWGASLKSTFGQQLSTEKQYVAVKLNQIFFTMAYEGPDAGVFGTFTDDITAREMQPYVGDGNPICYISSVSYGRSFIILYETEKTTKDFEASISAAYNAVIAGGNAAFDYGKKTTFESSTTKLVQVGGNAPTGLTAAVFKDSEALRKLIIDEAVPTTQNVAAPISYKIVHLRDNTPARVSNVLEYELTTQEFHSANKGNNVCIDFMSVGRQAPSTNSKSYHIWGGTQFKLNKLSVSRSGTDGIYTTETLIVNESASTDKHFFKTYQAEYGVMVPLYKQYRQTMPLASGCRIKITCEFWAQNHLRYNGKDREKADNTYTVVQEFQYDADSHEWIPLSDNLNNHPFGYMQKEEEFARVTLDFRLNYRFSVDGQVYSPDGKPTKKAE